MNSPGGIDLAEEGSREEELISIVYALEFLYHECRSRNLALTSHFVGVASEACKEELRRLESGNNSTSPKKGKIGPQTKRQTYHEQ